MNIRPHVDITSIKQSYLLVTNVILTRFFSEDHKIGFIDFIPIGESGTCKNQLIHIVKIIRGNAAFKFQLNFRPN